MKLFIQKIINYIVFVFYCGLSLVLTFPLVTNFSKAIPGLSFESFFFLWNQWWIRDAFLHFRNPYVTDLIAYPFQPSLVFHTIVFFNDFVSIPLQSIFSAVVSFNIIFILSLAASAFGMYLLVNYLFKNRIVAVLSGIFFVFNFYIYGEMLGHFQYVSVYPIPFFIYYFIKIFNDDKKINSILAGVFGAISIYNSYYYAFGLIFFVIITIGWSLFKNKELLFLKIKDFILVFFVCLALSLPVLYLSFKTALSGNYPFPMLDQINLYTPDLRSFLVPPTLHSVYGNNFINYYNSLSYHSSTVYLSYLLLIFAIIGYFFGKKNDFFLSSKFWLFFTIIFLFISLGPLLYLDGYVFHVSKLLTTIPLPYFLLYKFPFFNGILVPPRYIIFVIFGLIIISAFSLNALFTKIKSNLIKYSLASLIVGIFLFENFTLPIPISNVKVPVFYQELAKENEDYTLLELPFALSTSFYTLGSIQTSAQIQYFQTVHQKKILGGWISRVPNSYFDFYNKLVGLDYLINPDKNMEKNKIMAIRDNVKSNFNKLNVRYIIIHPEYYSHKTLRNSIDYLSAIYEKKPELIDGMLVYKIN